MLPRLSQRTYDLMRRAIDAVDKDTADLIATLEASAFVDGKEALEEDRDPVTEQLKGTDSGFLPLNDNETLVCSCGLSHAYCSPADEHLIS